MIVLIIDNIYYGNHYYTDIKEIKYDSEKNGYIVMTDKDGEVYRFFKNDIASITIVEGIK